MFASSASSPFGSPAERHGPGRTTSSVVSMAAVFHLGLEADDLHGATLAIVPGDPARVERINPSAQTGSRAVTVYLAMDGQPALRQGLYARGKIQLPPQMALAVPLSAVRTDQSLPYVLRLQDGRATAATVVLGRRGEVDGQPWVEVREGLQTGANVLTGTVGLVRDGTAITVAAAAAGRPASVAGAVQAVPTLPSPNSAASTPPP